jgi:uncharacterized protein (TIGR03000 family)
MYSEGLIVEEGAPSETPAPPAEGTEAPSVDFDEAPPEPAPLEGVQLDRSRGILTVRLPEDAKLYVNGQLTRSTGSSRRFVSTNLTAGNRYPYDLRAVIERDGREETRTKNVRLVAGDKAHVEFDFAAEQPVETKLTLNLPADATVELAGSATTSTGPVRSFSTTKLAEGELWSKYTVQVSVERDGRTLTKKQTIDLRGGESRDLDFEFDDSQVADAR